MSAAGKRCAMVRDVASHLDSLTADVRRWAAESPECANQHIRQFDGGERASRSTREPENHKRFRLTSDGNGKIAGDGTAIALDLRRGRSV
jgi:hypothetical protein